MRMVQFIGSRLLNRKQESHRGAVEQRDMLLRPQVLCQSTVPSIVRTWSHGVFCGRCSGSQVAAVLLRASVAPPLLLENPPKLADFPCKAEKGNCRFVSGRWRV